MERLLNKKQKVIKKFLIKLNKDTGDDIMPKHLMIRWNGFENKFYNKIWKELNGDNDIFLFDDFCEIGFDLSQGMNISLVTLMGDRLDNLYKYSQAMLEHYRISTIIAETISWTIRWTIMPLFYLFILPVYIVLRYLWLGWVIFANYFIRFIGEILTGDIFR